MRAFLSIVTAIALVCALPVRALAAVPLELTGADLVVADSGLDGAEVIFEGEVVSEALAGGSGHSWLNVLSGGVAVGVWAPDAMTDEVEAFGTWAHDGDAVRVTGTLNEGCDMHGGDLDVHASRIEVISPGAPREHPVEYWKLLPGIAGLIAAYAIVRRAWRREERPS